MDSCDGIIFHSDFFIFQCGFTKKYVSIGNANLVAFVCIFFIRKIALLGEHQGKVEHQSEYLKVMCSIHAPVHASHVIDPCWGPCHEGHVFDPSCGPGRSCVRSTLGSTPCRYVLDSCLCPCYLCSM